MYYVHNITKLWALYLKFYAVYSYEMYFQMYGGSLEHLYYFCHNIFY